MIGSSNEVSRVAQPDTKTKAVKHEAQGWELWSRGGAPTPGVVPPTPGWRRYGPQGGGGTPTRGSILAPAGGPQDGGGTAEATSAKNKPARLPSAQLT